MRTEITVDLTAIRQGRTQKIVTTLPPSLMEINEPELQFQMPVTIKGAVYLSEDHLIIHFHASTEALLPCAICNQMSPWELKISDFHHIEPIASLKNSCFDLAPIVREALLLELPKSIECNRGCCPKRSEISPYISTKKATSTHLPFANLSGNMAE